MSDARPSFNLGAEDHLSVTSKWRAPNKRWMCKSRKGYLLIISVLPTMDNVDVMKDAKLIFE